MSNITKRCPRCDGIKTAAEFFRNRRMTDGLSVYCKLCHQATRKDRKNPEDRAKAAKYIRKSRLTVPEKFRTRDRLRYQTNPRRREQGKKRAAEWYQENGAALREKQKADRKTNPDKYRNYELKKNFGITLEDWRRMLEAQDRRCANPGCRTTEPGGKYNNWFVDHDHTTKQIRGLLCFSCNLTLGNAKEDVGRLAGLIQYLQIQEPKSSEVVDIKL